MASVQYRSLSNVATETPLGMKCLIGLTTVMVIFFVISFILQVCMLNAMSELHVLAKHIESQLNDTL